MAQHFLRSAAARDKTISNPLGYSDEYARDVFAKWRWGSADKQVCPHCGVVDSHRWMGSPQKRWRCSSCNKGFSPTSGTIFNHHKLPLQKILAAIWYFVNGVKGLSAMELMREINVQYKTAFVLFHKIREALADTEQSPKLSGVVEIDGAYEFTYVRPANRKSDRKDVRLAKNQNKNKCVVLVMRERSKTAGDGAHRTKAFVVPSEDQKDVLPLVVQNVRPNSVIVTDEAPGYTALGAYYDHRTVNHSQEFQAWGPVNQNQAESYFSRLRRNKKGQHHRYSPQYLDGYAKEIAFRVDWCRRSNGDIFHAVLERAVKHAPSRKWAKYWQRRRASQPPWRPFPDEDFPL